ncbi:hypothetical protein [Winogradskyella sp.]|uniref:hypothetical protein n=1 Tax=Winogradskyella sp. TaxID=1883156 RepID=UPI001B1A478A|nr:hypothetical protein [Winogradskyella sp.]MBO6881454.1 hypothetical protein [Winogradskyella sp.]
MNEDQANEMLDLLQSIVNRLDRIENNTEINTSIDKRLSDIDTSIASIESDVNRIEQTC